MSSSGRLPDEATPPEEVVRTADRHLAGRPGDDAAHHLRARALMSLGRLADAEVDAAAAVRLDPDEVRYRELLAQILGFRGSHRDAALEYARLARGDPHQVAWAIAAGEEWLAAGSATEAVTSARDALRLDPAHPAGQLLLARGLAQSGDAAAAYAAAVRALQLRPDDPLARETLADAAWLVGQPAAAFAAFASLAAVAGAQDRIRIMTKARNLYRQRGGFAARILARSPAFFAFALGRGWLRIR